MGIRKSIEVFKTHPLYGRGLLTATQPEEDDPQAGGYGWVFWVSRLGLLIGPLYLYFMFKSIRNYAIVNHQTKKFAIIAFMALLAVLTGQKHTPTILFFMMFFTSIEFPLRNYFKYYVINHKYE